MVNQGLNLSLNELKLIAEHRNKKNKLKEIKEDFYNSKHNFSKKDADKYKRIFYDIKNYRHLFELEIEEIRKKFNKLEKSLNFKKPCNNINTIHYEDLNSNKEINLEDADDDQYRKIGSVRRLFEQSNRDYYKPRVIDRGFAGEVNNYIKYIS